MSHKQQALRVIQRGFLKGKLLWECGPVMMEPGEAVANLGREHAHALVAGEIDMIELEFPDLPLEDRFFRIGNSPEGMVDPVAIDLEG